MMSPNHKPRLCFVRGIVKGVVVIPHDLVRRHAVNLRRENTLAQRVFLSQVDGMWRLNLCRFASASGYDPTRGGLILFKF